MTPNLLDELEWIVALSKTATPGPWEVVAEAVNPYWRGDGTEVNSESGRIANCHADGLRVLENCQANAAIITLSVNFLRTHAPALADMAKRLEAAERDARRYRWLRDVWGGWMAVGSKMRADVRTPLWSGDWDSFDEAIDDIADFAATQEGEG